MVTKKTTGKVTDLVVYRAYTYKRINVLVKIDFLDKTVSLVERDDNVEAGFKPKEWLFADRTKDYLNGWLIILQAVEYAISEAKKELELAEERDTDKLLAVFVELNKIKDSET